MKEQKPTLIRRMFEGADTVDFVVARLIPHKDNSLDEAAFPIEKTPRTRTGRRT